MVRIFFIFIIGMSAIAHAQSARQDLLDLTQSIRQAEQRTSDINNKLSELQTKADDLKTKIITLEYDTTRHLQHIASLNKSNSALTYLSPHESFLDHHYNHQTQHSLKTILALRLQDHQRALQNLEKTEKDIQTYLYNRTEIEENIADLRQQINHNDQNLNIEITNKISILKQKNDNLDEFLKDILVLKDITPPESSLPLVFTLPLSGVINNNDDILSITAAPNALVTSPERAVVVYADSYKNLGNIVILNHGQGYTSILRGMGEIYVDTGYTIGKGEPIGILNGDGREKGGKRPMLSFQLRYNNQIINPIKKLTGL